MATEVKLPELGEGIESGDVLEVLVSEGDVISKNQDIIEVETDKATVPVPSSDAGTVSKIHVKQGDTLSIGDLILTLDSADAPAKETPQAAPPQEAAPKAEAPAPAAEKPAEKPAPAPTNDKPAAAKPATVAEPVEAVVEDAGDVVAAGPAVRRFAREVGVNLQTVSGTGPGGRILREDVLSVVRQSSKGAPAKAAKTTGKPAKSSTGQSDKFGPIRVEKMAKIRKTIAARMHESWQTCPRVTNFDDADVTDLEYLRQSSKEDYAAKGIKLTTMPFVIKAVAMALRNNPAINATVDMEAGEITYKEYVNVGIAVDTERGLVVPVLRDADEMAIPEVARNLADIAEDVRDGKFDLSLVQGGTFTISNLGAIGGTYSTPIINLPEVAILLIGRSRKLPTVVGDKIEPRLMMPLSLSYDHRLVDGATAARFLNEVIGYLKAPSRLLLAP
ncbi:MAG: 2-oxo acid dehydrogenase subunit E2 [bacterium]|nr:2-oxo acid dehydrogenase subunit E2 [bacterium]